MLAPSSSFWEDFSDVDNTLHVSSPLFPLKQVAKNYEKTVLIPMTVNDYLNAPQEYFTLKSPRKTIEMLHDKLLFKEFLVESSLGEYAPRLLDPQSYLQAPFMLKRTDLLGGQGVFKIEGSNHYKWARESAHILGHPYLLEEFIRGDIELVTHLICKKGQILWSVTLEGGIPLQSQVNLGAFATRISKINGKACEVLREIVRLSNYSGPASVNYKVWNGQPYIFDFNPRLGGSLFSKPFREQARRSIRAFLDHAELSYVSGSLE